MGKLITRNLFVDASIFRREGFNLTGRKLQVLLDLAKNGTINVYSTDIAFRETESLLDENLDEISSILAKLQNKLAPFKECLSEAFLENFIPEQNLVLFESARNAFHQYIENIYMEFIPTTEVDTSKVFISYFERKPPFGDGKKKAEFPDAFSLFALEDWCARENQNIYVVSADGDMESYCNSSDKLHYLSDLSQFIDLVNLEDTLIASKVHVWFMNNQALLLDVVNKNLKERIQRHSISIEGLSEVAIDLQAVELNQQVYSVDISGNLAYAYTKALTTFVAKGLYSWSWLQNQIRHNLEKTIDEQVNFEARWTVNCEVEIELTFEPPENDIEFSGAWVIGEISLKLQEADKLLAI